jgi:ABC-type phosphate transport system substrate-binding protein
MAALIFGAKAVYWQDFGRYFDGDDNTGTTQDRITACFRHAGSGTHATMDLGLMRGNGWGITLDQTQNTDTLYGSTRWFNDGSGDLAKCLQELTGSVGYADCDQLAGQDPITAKKVHALKYQGAECNRYNVRNGVYEFWSKSHLYYKTPSADEVALFNALFAFAEDPAKIPATKAQWWAADKEMKVRKATDFNYLNSKPPVGGPYLP